jgi:hypothetical protein
MFLTATPRCELPWGEAVRNMLLRIGARIGY